MNLNREEQQKKVCQLMAEVDRICSHYNILYSLGYGSVLGAVRHQGFIPWDSDIDIFLPITEMENFRIACHKELPEGMCILEWDKQRSYSPCFDRVVFQDIPHGLVHVDAHPLSGLPRELKQKNRHIKICYYVYHLLQCKHVDTKFSRKSNVWKIQLLKLPLKLVPDRIIWGIYYRLQTRYDYEQATEVYSMASRYTIHDYTVKKDIFDTIRVPFEDLLLPIPRAYDRYLTHIYGDYMTPKEL